MYRRGEKAYAEVAFKQLAVTVPGHIGAEFGLASLAFDKGELHNAEAGFTALVGRVKDVAPVYLKLGETQLALGSYDKAALTFGKIIQNAPFDAQAHYKQGVALAGAGRKEEAARVFSMIERYDFDDAMQQTYVEKSREALRRIVSEQRPAQKVRAAKPKKVAKRPMQRPVHLQLEREPAFS
jgi:tetratricopeptide (TPR) repeat protein